MAPMKSGIIAMAAGSVLMALATDAAVVPVPAPCAEGENTVDSLFGLLAMVEDANDNTSQEWTTICVRGLIDMSGGEDPPDDVTDSDGGGDYVKYLTLKEGARVHFVGVGSASEDPATSMHTGAQDMAIAAVGAQPVDSRVLANTDRPGFTGASKTGIISLESGASATFDGLVFEKAIQWSDSDSDFSCSPRLQRGCTGAIQNNGTIARIDNCVFRDNVIPAGLGPDQTSLRGALNNMPRGKISHIYRTEFRDNQAIGAGIYNAGEIMKIEESNFSNNKATYGERNQDIKWTGAAIFNHEDGHITTITGCVFDGNKAQDNGGAVFLDGPVVNLLNSTFVNNVAEDDGGAFWMSSTTMERIVNCHFENNSAVEGGVAEVEGNIREVSNSIFVNNEAKEEGGVFNCDGRNCVFDLITGCHFEGNTVEGTLSAENNDGGVINIEGSVNIRHSTFIRNSADDKGGALWIDRLGFADIQSCSFEDNNALKGGAIFTTQSGELLISDVTFIENNAEEGGANIYVEQSGIVNGRTCDLYAVEDEGVQAPDIVCPNQAADDTTMIIVISSVAFGVLSLTGAAGAFVYAKKTNKEKQFPSIYYASQMPEWNNDMDDPNMTGPYDPNLGAPDMAMDEHQTEAQVNTVKNKAAGAEAAALSTQVDPKYIIPRESLKLGRVIGRGTFGTVQIAEWGAKSLVAVKCIPWDDDADNANVRKQMVLREINMLCNLHYPNIVTFYGICESAKTLMLVQELCTGGNLRNIMRRRQEFLDQNKINFMHQIACAMEYLHGKGVIHRDLKPENVLLGGHGANTCKLCDFGLARPNDAADKMATMTVGVGTALYMAPEVLQEANGTTARVEADGDKCDVFSGAIMFVEMLRPNTDIYPGEPTMTVSYKVLHQNLRPKFPSGVQPAIADLISEMWVHDPSSRPCYAEVARRISEHVVEES